MKFEKTISSGLLALDSTSNQEWWSQTRILETRALSLEGLHLDPRDSQDQNMSDSPEFIRSPGSVLTEENLRRHVGDRLRLQGESDDCSSHHITTEDNSTLAAQDAILDNEGGIPCAYDQGGEEEDHGLSWEINQGQWLTEDLCLSHYRDECLLDERAGQSWNVNWDADLADSGSVGDIEGSFS